MDCFPDFCLGCDSQAVDGLYCSETCRMNDIERSASTSSSPVQHHGHHFPQSQPTSSHSSSRSKDSSTTNQTRTHRSLSASSSRSSLHSACSSETSQVSTDISADDARALQSFFNAFDRTRYEKRRPAPATYTQWSSLIKMNG